MADIIINLEFNNPTELLGQGIKAYMMKDYNSAVEALSQASAIIVNEHNDDKHDSLGEIYLFYGKALLELSREEAEPIGDIVPRGSESETDEDNEQNEINETEGNQVSTNGSEKQNSEVSTNAEGKDLQGVNEVTKEIPELISEVCETLKTEEEPTDLQLAWEVLELAKLIFINRGENGVMDLAETLITLGDISLENDIFETGIEDIKEALKIQKEKLESDCRKLAETYYKLGIAFCSNNQLTEAIETFSESLKILNNRLQTLKENKKIANSHKQVENLDGEIDEIMGLIPEIEEKIKDAGNSENAMEKLKQAFFKSELQPGSSSSPEKIATNISHLVKRKRSIDDVANNLEGSPTKKMIVEEKKSPIEEKKSQSNVKEIEKK